MKCNISKEEFIKQIGYLDSLYDKEYKFCNALEELCPDFRVEAYIYSAIVDNFVNFLDTLMETDLISYFVWELDFGRNELAKNCIKDNDKEISLTTAADLYDYIVGSQN